MAVDLELIPLARVAVVDRLPGGVVRVSPDLEGEATVTVPLTLKVTMAITPGDGMRPRRRQRPHGLPQRRIHRAR
jgi:hypothetical protein